jgi:hypothetical protein
MHTNQKRKKKKKTAQALATLEEKTGYFVQMTYKQ